MPILLLLLAALALLAGLVLWALDSARRTKAAGPAEPAEEVAGVRELDDSPARQVGGSAGPDAAASEPTPPAWPAAPAAGVAREEAPEESVAEEVPSEDVEVVEVAEDADAGIAEAASGRAASGRTELGASEPEEAQPSGVEAEEPEREQPGAQAPAEPDPTEQRGFRLPGATRRERRAFAERRGFDFAKSDDFLPDEWSFGPASAKVTARDVVSGTVGDRAAGVYEFHLLDLGPATVLAVRLSAEQGIRLEFHRPGARAEAGLIPTGTFAGFELFANDEAAAERFVDARVLEALGRLSEEVQLVWTEAEWILAQLVRGARTPVAEAALNPLCELADAARVLPPAGSAPELDLASLDPTRTLPPEHQPEADSTRDGVAEHASATRPGTPVVMRPEEPLDMPSRVQPKAHGVVEAHVVGDDEVAAIATRPPEPGAGDDFLGTRVVRRGERGSSIFDDLSAELGGNPLADHGDEERAEVLGPEAGQESPETGSADEPAEKGLEGGADGPGNMSGHEPK